MAYAKDYTTQIGNLVADVEVSGMTDEKRELTLAHVNYLKALVVKKIIAIQSRLDYYRGQLETTESDNDQSDSFSTWRSERLAKKIRDAEKKLERYNELLLAIELLKLKINTL